MHLDIEVHDLEAAGSYAAQLGATLANCQPQQGVRVYLDSAGYPSWPSRAWAHGRARKEIGG